jgi:hypothetical protein
VVDIEHPHIGPTDPWGSQLRITPRVLPAVCCRDKGPLAFWAREYDVPRLVADEQGSHHATARSKPSAQVDDAHAVREVVHDPHLGVRARGDRYRFQADRDGIDVFQPALADPEDFEAVVGCIDSKEMRAVGRQRKRTDLAALEQRERRFRAGWCNRHNP